TVIEGYTSTLLSHRRRLAPREQDECVQMIQQAGRRLGRLTEQLLEIAQFQAGGIQISFGRVDICTLARQAIKEAEHRLPDPLRGLFPFRLVCRDTLGNLVQELPTVNCLLVSDLKYSLPRQWRKIVYVWHWLVLLAERLLSLVSSLVAALRSSAMLCHCRDGQDRALPHR
ncbi:MAG TPA: hypothetical protein VFB12_15510, partial [Ktedonobacteraceae bacterium]|nr:hypothetical protein [Ktedonobacteraceae bacterium]